MVSKMENPLSSFFSVFTGMSEEEEGEDEEEDELEFIPIGLLSTPPPLQV